jgi:type IV secretion system protein VirB9
MKHYNKILLSIFLLLGNNKILASDAPVTIDSRIKTYIYNENEIFLIKVYNGYQSSIELGKGEELETLSVGDTFAWKITPVGRRIFIKPLEDNVHTNMTLITNKRTYHFDIISKSPDEEIDKNIVYVLRFYYPEENRRRE